MSQTIDRAETGKNVIRGGDVRTTVAIVGAGASGTLTAVHLLRYSTDAGLRVVLFEARPQQRHHGVAYSTTDRRHLLNVRAENMSAFPDEPGHFVEWARRTGHDVGPTDFLPRTVYGEYLRHLVAEFCNHRLTVVPARVDDVRPLDDGFEITAGTTTLRAGSVVLAHGNAAPRPLAVADAPLADAPWHLPNAWDLDALANVPDNAKIVLVGSGLTAVDAAITLLDDAPGRQVVMVSRHGELPRPHLRQDLTPWQSPIPAGPLTADGLAALVCGQIDTARREGVDWRAVIDGLRGATPSMWDRLNLAERRRFLAAHLRAWDVRRTRMAPQIAERIDAYRASGRLSVLGGGLRWIDDRGDRCRIGLESRTLDTDALVNCTGPLTDVTNTDPMLRRMADRGTVTSDPLGLGLACTTRGQVLGRSGRVVPGLFTLGPPAKGAYWESIAVPEIRVQAAQLAQRLVAVTAP
jgi:uncharacterized NAD(P)/FAD-binding protein YdhS